MFEGKNIHYSRVDHKPLCSFSAKICKQRRLNGYAFCVRHILEDPEAPFKQCAYVAKYNKHKCTQAIPHGEEREYCNSHMQVVGMLPKKERRPKERDGASMAATAPESRMSLEDRLKSKFNLRRNSNSLLDDDPFQDPDDPYAFPDPVSEPPVKPNSSPAQASVASESSNQSMPCTKSNEGTTSSIAKLYPELAEKLERAKTKMEPREPKNKGNASKSSSRTMNRLQTKIAQNRIKDKLKKNQELVGHTGSDLQTLPSTPSTPSTPPLLRQSLNASKPHFPTDLHMTSGAVDASPPAPPGGLTPGLAVTPPQLHGQPQPSGLSPVPPHWMGIQEVNRSPVVVPSGQQPPPYKAPQPQPKPQPQPQPQPPALPPTQQQPPHPPHTHNNHHHNHRRNRLHRNHQHHPPVAMPPQPFPLPPPPPGQGMHLPHVGTPVTPYLPPKYIPPYFPILHTRPKRPRNVLTESEARKRLKRHSAVKAYAYHASKKVYNADLLLYDAHSSDDDSDVDDVSPWQQCWFTPSSDSEPDLDDLDDDEVPMKSRPTKLSLAQARLRRRFLQIRKALRAKTPLETYEHKSTFALIQAARKDTAASVRSLIEMRRELVPRKPIRSNQLPSRACLIKQDGDKPCTEDALPYTNHCIKHILYNVDQQLFDYCTAKFADNTQCCIPVFDVRHELPLCLEHAAKADNYNKQNPEIKPKKPRKKTKPSALTRPPKKGKKKKNQKRNVRPQKPIPPSSPTGNVEMPASDVDLDISSTSLTDGGPANPPSGNHSVTSDIPDPLEHDLDKALGNALEKDLGNDIGKELGNDLGALEHALSPGTIDKSFADIPYDGDQAAVSKLLDENDIHDVLNKLPEEAFDILTGQNGQLMPTKEEAEELERALAAASKDVNDAQESLAQFSQDGHIDDELTKHLADTLLNSDLNPEKLANELATGAMHDDLTTDNLSAIASSISAHDLKSMSQLTTSILNSALGSDAMTYAHSQQPQGHQPQVQGQIRQGHMQQGHLSQGHLHIQLPGAVNTLSSNPSFTMTIPSANSNNAMLTQQAFPLNHAVFRGAAGAGGGGGSETDMPALRQYGSSIIAQHRVLADNLVNQRVLHTEHLPSPLQPTTPSPLPIQSPLHSPQPNAARLQWAHPTNPAERPTGPTTYHNGFPVNHAAPVGVSIAHLTPKFINQHIFPVHVAPSVANSQMTQIPPIDGQAAAPTFVSYTVNSNGQTTRQNS